MRRTAYRPLTAGKHAEGAWSSGFSDRWRYSTATCRCRCRGRGSAACSRCSCFMQTRLSRRTGSIDELWPAEASESRSAALQASVSRLRKALGGGSELLATVPPGYVVRIGSDQLDLASLRGPRRRGRRRGSCAAADELREALALWRGPALAEFAYEPFAETAIGRLDELHLLALEKRIDADLALGRHRDLVPELEALVAQHPLREGLRVQLMLALYRGGRQADALEAFQAARRTLVEQLGIEPGSALRSSRRPSCATIRLSTSRSPSGHSARSSSQASTLRRSNRCSRWQSRSPKSPRER